MDLRFTPEEVAFREEVREFFGKALPENTRRKMEEGRSLAKDDIVTWQRILNGKGLGGAVLAGRIRRHRLDADAAVHLPGGDAAGAGAAAAAVRRQHGRPGDLHVRHRGAEGANPAAHRQHRRLVVPGLLRARLGLRPRLAEDHGQARRRPLRRQRPEDLDDARAIRRLDLLPGAHRPDRQEAGGHLLPAHRHEDARHHRAADPDHRRRPRGQRGVLRRRARAGRRTWSARRTRAGTTPSSCSATSASASPASACPSSASAASRNWRRRNSTATSR